MGYELVGQAWDVPAFRGYVATLPRLPWAKSVTLHHTASPSLAQRPDGWRLQHMRNLQHHYQQTLGWSAGPHLFTDEDQVFGMSSLYRRGVHARSFNATSIGIEVLGDYDREDPKNGRGLACWTTTAAVVRLLLDHLGLEASADTVKFHRDDPKTSKTCPGKLVRKEWFLHLLGEPDDREGGPDKPAPDERLKTDLLSARDNIQRAIKRLTE